MQTDEQHGLKTSYQVRKKEIDGILRLQSNQAQTAATFIQTLTGQTQNSNFKFFHKNYGGLKPRTSWISPERSKQFPVMRKGVLNLEFYFIVKVLPHKEYGIKPCEVGDFK